MPWRTLLEHSASPVVSLEQVGEGAKASEEVGEHKGVLCHAQQQCTVGQLQNGLRFACIKVPLCRLMGCSEPYV